jgi:hypothetical protein
MAPVVAIRESGAQTMHHDPGTLVCDIESFLDLSDAYAAVCRHKEVNDLKPFMQRDMARFKNGSDSDRKLAFTFRAVKKAGATTCNRP